MRPRARHLLLTLPLSLATCMSGAESVCHQAAVQRLGCCPLCDEGCGQDPQTLQKIEACVEALELVDEDAEAEADAPDDDATPDDETPDDDATPDDGDRPDAPFD